MLKAAQANSGYVSIQSLRTEYSWEPRRALAAIEHLQKEGMCWLDDISNCCKEKTDDTVNRWWFPSVALSPLAENGGQKGGEEWRVYDE